MNYPKEDLAELRLRVDEILFYMWDPIGMSYEPASRDEYCDYVDGIFEILIQPMSVIEMFKKLSSMLIMICEDYMYHEPGADKKHCRKISIYMIKARKWISEERRIAYEHIFI